MDYNHVVDRIGEVIAGVAVLVAGAVIAVVAAAVRLGHHQAGVYRRSARSSAGPSCWAWSYWWPATSSARVAAQPILTSVGILAIIVLIRTFLSFSLEVELTGRWPWQKNTAPLPPE